MVTPVKRHPLQDYGPEKGAGICPKDAAILRALRYCQPAMCSRYHSDWYDGGGGGRGDAGRLHDPVPSISFCMEGDFRRAINGEA